MSSDKKPIRIDGLLIAAGSSSRLGQPKQLLTYNGQLLINYTLDQLIKSELNAIHVVLGSNAELIKSNIKEEAIIWKNEEWKKGMGTSIAFGINKLKDISDGVLISLVDQYKQDEYLINKLIKSFNENISCIVASKYQNKIIGVPAIFPKSKFNQLIKLNKDKGAGKLINSTLKTNPELIKVINFPDGNIDVDTPEDLSNLL